MKEKNLVRLTPGEKIKIWDNNLGGMSTAAFGLTFRWQVILNSTFEFIFHFDASLPVGALLYYIVCS